MTQETELFAEDTIDPVVIPEGTDPLALLVGEGKKFKTPVDLARGKLESDQFIKQLQAELATIRTELNGKIKLEDFMNRLEASKPANPGTAPATSAQANPATADSPKTLTQEDIESLLSKREKAAVEQSNLRQVAEALRAKYGDNFKQVVNQKAKELDLGPEYLTVVAKERPQAFLKLLSAVPDAAPAPDRNFTPSNVNTQGFKRDGNAPPKKFSDFEKIRREDFRKYMSIPVQQEMYALTKEYGDDFLKS